MPSSAVREGLNLRCLAVAGLGLSGEEALRNVLVRHMADEDELRCGMRREGALFWVDALPGKEGGRSRWLCGAQSWCARSS